MDALKNHLIEVILLNTHNLHFSFEMRIFFI